MDLLTDIIKNRRLGAFSRKPKTLARPPSKLVIATQNINGLNTYEKLAEKMSLLYNNSADIILVQETHIVSSENERKVQSQWQSLGGGKTFFAPTDNCKSRGCAILFKSRIPIAVTKFIPSPDGRSILIDIDFEDLAFRIINVYAPNNPTERINFFSELAGWLLSSQKDQGRQTILAGDFNMVEDAALDRVSLRQSSLSYAHDATKGANVLGQVLKTANLTDIFRLNDQFSKIFTWSNKRTPPDLCQCRLDRIYIPTTSATDAQITFSGFSNLSDHQMVILHLKTRATKTCDPGPGYWQLNTTLLENDDYVGMINAILEVETANPQSLDPLTLWERTKAKIKAHSMNFGKKLAAYNRKVQKEALKQKDNLDPSNPRHLSEIQRLNDIIQAEMKRKNDGFLLRAKVDDLETGEKMSAYFFHKMKQNRDKSTITELKTDTQTLTETSDILNEIQHFYKDLYTNTHTDDDTQRELLNKIQRTIQPTSRGLLESDLSLDNLTNAVSSLKNRKTPGSDGLPVEFYKKFWDQIGPLLLQVSTFVHKNDGQLPTSMRMAYVRLIHKGGETHHLGNWRPVSLLNADYKVISKALAQKLHTVLAEVIHPDQTCGVPGRNIQDNLLTLRDFIQYSQTHNEPFLFLNIDQEKAFDRVDYTYLQNVLTKMGFGPNFRRWISILYKNRSANFLNNGFKTMAIEILRGLLQGCPLAQLLYIIGVEPLCESIRSDSKIHGIPLPIDIIGREKTRQKNENSLGFCLKKALPLTPNPSYLLVPMRTTYQRT